MNELNLNNHSVLYDVAEEITSNEDIDDLIDIMKKVMAKSKVKAIGLAAPQIGISKRLIIIHTPTLKVILINPVITRRRLGKSLSKEGCLSFPGLIKKVKRDKQIVVEGFNQYWKQVKFKLRGLDSFVIQHEIDHLNGITLRQKQ